jgi:hypothetical protein
MKNRKIAKVFGIIGFILSIPIILLTIVGTAILGAHVSAPLALGLFALLTFPAILGFIFSLRVNKAKVSSGIWMIVCGLLILIPGLITGVLLVAIIPGLLFTLGGVLSLTSK